MNDSAEALSRLLRVTGRMGSLEADLVAGRVLQVAGTRGLALVEQAANAGLEVVEVSFQLIRTPHLSGLGLDGVRAALLVGPRAALDLGSLGPAALHQAVADTAQASWWLRLLRMAQVLTPAVRQRLVERFLKDPAAFERYLLAQPGPEQAGGGLTGLGLIALGTGTASTVPPTIASEPEAPVETPPGAARNGLPQP